MILHNKEMILRDFVANEFRKYFHAYRYEIDTDIWLSINSITYSLENGEIGFNLMDENREDGEVVELMFKYLESQNLLTLVVSNYKTGYELSEKHKEEYGEVIQKVFIYIRKFIENYA